MTAVPASGYQSVLRDAQLTIHQFRFEVLSFMRNRQARFFTVMLPVLFLVIFASVFGNKNIPIGHGKTMKLSTYYIPALTSLGIISAAYTNLVSAVVMQRENGILKRRRAAPVPSYVLILGRGLVSVVIALFMCALMLTIGSVFYGATVPTHTLPAVAVTTIVGSLAFCTVGFGVSTFIRHEESAQPVIQFTLLPLYFISGVFVAQSQIPGWLTDVADVFPVRHLSNALLTAFLPTTKGAGFNGDDLLIMGVWGVAGLVVGLRRFSWSPLGK